MLAVKSRIDELLRGEDIADPINLFIKQEAHKVTKIQEGRYRLISGVSLVDSLVDRILWMPLTAKLEETSCRLKPALFGWTPFLGGFRRLARRFRHKTTVSIDRKAWDWTVQGHMVDLLLEALLHLGFVSNDASWWTSLAEARFRMLFEKAVFQFPDSTKIEQKGRGIMKSGCYLTLVGNSFMQYLLHCLVCYDLGLPVGKFFAVGDDTLQELPLGLAGTSQLDEYVSVLSGYGPILKTPDVREKNKAFEFVGFNISRLELLPAYREKHLFNLRRLDDDVAVSALRSYQILYGFDTDMQIQLCEVQMEVYGEVPMKPGACRLILCRQD